MAADLHERLGARKYPDTSLYVVKAEDIRKMPVIKFELTNGVELELNALAYTAKICLPFLLVRPYCFSYQRYERIFVS